MVPSPSASSSSSPCVCPLTCPCWPACTVMYLCLLSLLTNQLWNMVNVQSWGPPQRCLSFLLLQPSRLVVSAMQLLRFLFTSYKHTKVLYFCTTTINLVVPYLFVLLTNIGNILFISYQHVSNEQWLCFKPYW